MITTAFAVVCTWAFAASFIVICKLALAMPQREVCTFAAASLVFCGQNSLLEKHCLAHVMILKRFCGKPPKK